MNIENSIEELNQAFIDFKSKHNCELNKIQEENTMINTQTKELQEKIEQKLQKLELKRPELSISTTDVNTDEIQFKKFLYESNSQVEKKSSAYSSQILLPANMTCDLCEKIKELSPIKKFAKNIKTSANSIEIITSTNTEMAGWSDNKNFQPKSEIFQITKQKIDLHEMFARPKATQDMLEDYEKNVEEWLISAIANEFTILETNAFINGDGINKPKGILYYANEENKNSQKSFGILTANSQNGVLDANFSNKLVSLMYSLESKYMKNAKWFMSRAMLAEIIKLKNNSDKNLVCQLQTNNDDFPTLYGHPIVICDEIPYDISNPKNFPIFFGDMEATYTVADKTNITILKDPFSTKPLIEFYVSKKVGGDVVNFESLKLLKIKK